MRPDAFCYRFARLADGFGAAEPRASRKLLVVPMIGMSEEYACSRAIFNYLFTGSSGLAVFLDVPSFDECTLVYDTGAGNSYWYFLSLDAIRALRPLLASLPGAAVFTGDATALSAELLPSKTGATEEPACGIAFSGCRAIAKGEDGDLPPFLSGVLRYSFSADVTENPHALFVRSVLDRCSCGSEAPPAYSPVESVPYVPRPFLPLPSEALAPALYHVDVQAIQSMHGAVKATTTLFRDVGSTVYRSVASGLSLAADATSAASSVMLNYYSHSRSRLASYIERFLAVGPPSRGSETGASGDGASASCIGREGSVKFHPFSVVLRDPDTKKNTPTPVPNMGVVDVCAYHPVYPLYARRCIVIGGHGAGAGAVAASQPTGDESFGAMFEQVVGAVSTLLPRLVQLLLGILDIGQRPYRSTEEIARKVSSSLAELKVRALSLLSAVLITSSMAEHEAVMRAAVKLTSESIKATVEHYDLAYDSSFATRGLFHVQIALQARLPASSTRVFTATLVRGDTVVSTPSGCRVLTEGVSGDDIGYMAHGAVDRLRFKQGLSPQETKGQNLQCTLRLHNLFKIGTKVVPLAASVLPLDAVAHVNPPFGLEISPANLRDCYLMMAPNRHSQRFQAMKGMLNPSVLAAPYSFRSFLHRGSLCLLAQSTAEGRSAQEPGQDVEKSVYTALAALVGNYTCGRLCVSMEESFGRIREFLAASCSAILATFARGAAGPGAVAEAEAQAQAASPAQLQAMQQGIPPDFVQKAGFVLELLPANNSALRDLTLFWESNERELDHIVLGRDLVHFSPDDLVAQAWGLAKAVSKDAELGRMALPDAVVASIKECIARTGMQASSIGSSAPPAGAANSSDAALSPAEAAAVSACDCARVLSHHGLEKGAALVHAAKLNTDYADMLYPDAVDLPAARAQRLEKAARRRELLTNVLLLLTADRADRVTEHYVSAMTMLLRRASASLAPGRAVLFRRVESQESCKEFLALLASPSLVNTVVIGYVAAPKATLWRLVLAASEGCIRSWRHVLVSKGLTSTVTPLGYGMAAQRDTLFATFGDSVLPGITTNVVIGRRRDQTLSHRDISYIQTSLAEGFGGGMQAGAIPVSSFTLLADAVRADTEIIKGIKVTHSPVHYQLEEVLVNPKIAEGVAEGLLGDLLADAASSIGPATYLAALPLGPADAPLVFNESLEILRVAESFNPREDGERVDLQKSLNDVRDWFETCASVKAQLQRLIETLYKVVDTYELTRGLRYTINCGNRIIVELSTDGNELSVESLGYDAFSLKLSGVSCNTEFVTVSLHAFDNANLRLLQDAALPSALRDYSAALVESFLAHFFRRRPLPSQSSPQSHSEAPSADRPASVEAVTEYFRSEKLPSGWFSDGPSYVSVDGERSGTRPDIDELVKRYSTMQKNGTLKVLSPTTPLTREVVVNEILAIREYPSDMDEAEAGAAREASTGAKRGSSRPKPQPDQDDRSLKRKAR